MDKYLKQNKAHWNEVTPIHVCSGLYNVDDFKAGKHTLVMPLEVEEMGDIRCKSLLHLQCHFGMDTLFWARQGARVTGVDFSEVAINTARKLNREIGTKARFIESDIYALKSVLKEKFDIVYTGGGAICWLPDLKKWGQIISHFLNPGGFFYIMEGHPFMNVFDNSHEAKELKVMWSYFNNPEWLELPPDGDYTDRDAHVINGTCEWTHSLGDIINGLVQAGLKIEFLHEYSMIPYKVFPFMVKGKDNFWHLEGDKLPQIFSIKASK